MDGAHFNQSEGRTLHFVFIVPFAKNMSTPESKYCLSSMSAAEITSFLEYEFWFDLENEKNHSVLQSYYSSTVCCGTRPAERLPP